MINSQMATEDIRAASLPVVLSDKKKKNDVEGGTMFVVAPDWKALGRNVLQ